MQIKYLLILIVVVSYARASMGQSLHNDVQKIYNFEPHKISKEQQEQKGKLLDAFWEKVQKEKEKYLEPLRVELRDTTNPSFFLYDGGHLLLSLSKSKEDYQLALDAMTKCDLRDIDPADYLQTMNFFAENDLNTTAAALKIIAVDSFSAFIPLHALAVDKGLALLFILLPINTDLYLKTVIDQLSSAKDAATRKYLLSFLLYTCTCEGDAVILKYSTDKDPEVREFAIHEVELNHVSRSANRQLYQDLVKKRKEILSRISDEALDELDELSKTLKKQYDCK
ncbi:MAG: hypothetical protein Q8916_12430 [Bacteroidota bacterium]|nr:hypothetical protein [Bacteroidota bacterium]MDP4231199.1 hypothetical protein [Bacteroidota bacterium]MDP4235334.1 hypothetical protein [Bacteroidota bacterium]